MTTKKSMVNDKASDIAAPVRLSSICLIYFNKNAIGEKEEFIYMHRIHIRRNDSLLNVCFEEIICL